MVILKHNWPWKLLSLGIAVLVAVYVRKQEDAVQRYLWLDAAIPVPAGQRLVEVLPSPRIQVTLDGPSELVNAITSDDLRVDLDLARLVTGQRSTIPVTISLAQRYADRVRVRWQPQRLQVRVVSDAVEELPVSIKPLNAPAGWQLTAPLKAEPERVTVSGTEEAVSRVASVVAAFTIPDGARISEQVTLQAVDQNGNNVTRNVEIRPAQVLVTGMQERIVLQKQVPVQPVFTAPAGTAVSVNVSPPRVRALGPEAEIADLYVVETEPIALPSGQPQVTREVALKPPKPGIQLQPARVKVTLKIGQAR
jgi:YbbR domain-containing protein